MIKADIFNAAFKRGFASQKTSPLVKEQKGKTAKYRAIIGEEEISLWFKVNSKVPVYLSNPGEFWPVIEAARLGYNERDNGTISWYQYTDELINDEMKAFQWSVYNKVAAQTEFELKSEKAMRDVSLPGLRRDIEGGFRVSWPHQHLYYLDGQDAAFWGKLFAVHLVSWVEKFSANPETLEGYMWRVHWS